MGENFDLERLVRAQAPVLDAVRAELRAGRKRSHWMWFVFPQLAGLGHSTTARHYAIASLDEARAYLAHPVLGSRLRECARLMNALAGRTAHDVLGSPDDLKFHSSMTLFMRAAPSEPVFREALGHYFDGALDEGTLRLLPACGN